ncbi:MAG: hypothetical protein E7056_03380 [Lentisphaerae bacterium]|nr:hypothetical protein [Lentisphaerota bacterium]
MYDFDEIAAMQQQAVELELQYPIDFLQKDPAELQPVLNGYGSANCPEMLRQLLSRAFGCYPTAAAIHDLRYEQSDGTEDSRRRADREFAYNLRTLWLHRYGTRIQGNWLAIYALIKLILAYAAVSWFGRNAWLRSYSKNQMAAPEAEYE